MRMPISYDFDSPNSGMFQTSPLAHPLFLIKSVKCFLYHSTFPRLSRNLEKLGSLSQVSLVGMASLQEQRARPSRLSKASV